MDETLDYKIGRLLEHLKTAMRADLRELIAKTSG